MGNGKIYTQLKSYPSKSSSNIYWVSKDEEGKLSCNCRGWIYHRGKTRGCAHTRDYESQERPQAYLQDYGNRKPVATDLRKKLSQVLGKRGNSAEVNKALKIFEKGEV